MNNPSLPKHILVTGGLGSIGHVLCRRLLESGYKVSVVDDLSVGKKEFLGELPGAEFYECNVANYEQFERAFKGGAIHSIVHLAARHYIPYCESHPEETKDTNIGGVMNALLLMKKYAVPHIVFASTSSVYKPSSEPYKESDPLQPVNLYGFSKLVGEHMIRQFTTLYDTTFSILRFYNVYGVDDLVPHVIPEIVEQARKSDVVKVGNVNARRDFIHVNDLTAAIALCLTNNAAWGQTYNVGTGKARSIKEVIDAVKKASGKDLIIEEDEKRKRKADPSILLADNSKIIRELGWKPQEDFSLEEIFKKTKYWPVYL